MVAARELEFAGRALADLRPRYDARVDPLTGGAALNIAVPLTPGRRGFGPSLSLTVGDDGTGGVFGYGIVLTGLPSVEIDTRDGLPRYDGTDRFAWNGRDLVPVEVQGQSEWLREEDGVSYRVSAFRARVESTPVRVERWLATFEGATHFRVREDDGSVGIYGQRGDGSSRVFDPDRPERVFRYLLEARYDAYGNAWFVDYSAEDDRGADAAELRFGGARAARYPKRISYGNRTSLREGQRVARDDFAFHVAFDYGDHPDDRLEPSADWAVRPDPFSTGRPGFAMRTRRLCRRILMFHRFPAALGQDATLVRAIEFEHESDPAGARLRAVQVEGVRQSRGTTQRRAEPTLRVAHRPFRLGSAEDEVLLDVQHALGAGSRLLDLFGEGLPAIVTEARGAFYYSENLGGGRFGARRLLAERPTTDGGGFELRDFDGDGNLEAVTLAASRAGFFRLDREQGSWEPFRALPSAPRADARRVALADIDGDGRADFVVFDDTGFSWFAFRGDEGFEGPEHVALDLERAPAAGPALHRFFADMTGDGLVDLVEVRNGSVRYFPNLGRGRFGDAVWMDDAPRLDHEGAFDPARVRLVDLRGTGAADLLYLGCGELRVFRNARGNRFLPEERVALPCSADVASADVADILGDGTACLVWFSRQVDGSSGMRAIRLQPDGPPGVLEYVDDGLGQRTVFEHRSSALEYRRDVEEGRGWTTRLPSHRQVVTRLELVDLVDGGRTGRTFSYHDGHFDSLERQFVGFLQVDEVDVLEPAARFETTVATLTLRFHHAGDDKLRGASFVFDADPRGPPLVTGPAAATWRQADHDQALRALGGHLVRTEIAAHGRAEPLVVRESAAHAILLRRADVAFPRGAFRVQAAESKEVTLEQSAADRRVVRTLALEHDAYGFLSSSADLARAREVSTFEAQANDLGTASRARFAHVDEPQRFVLGLPVEQSSYELVAIDSGLELRRAREVIGAAVEAAELSVSGASEGARLLRRSRTLYWNDERTAALPLGHVGSPVLARQQREAAFTGEQFAGVFGTLGDPAALASGAGYELEGALWWRGGPVQHFGGSREFFTVERVERAPGAVKLLGYDNDRVALTSVTDELRNAALASIDYHLLAPARIEDANGFVREVEYDALGVVVRATAYGAIRAADGGQRPYGHGPLPNAAVPTIDQALGDPEAALAGVGQLYAYEFEGAELGRAPRSLTLASERFAGDEPRAQVALTYLDGFGRALQQKQRVEAGPAVARRADGSLELDRGMPVLRASDMRWRVSGFRTYDAKAQLQREHEPFFSSSAELELDAALRALGSATTLHYDALGRVVRESYADGTLSRVAFEPWRVQRFDANDTVHEDGAASYRTSRNALPASDPRRIALERALEHQATPSAEHLDPFGRAIATEQLASGRRALIERSVLDGAGEPVQLTDARGIVSFTYERDLLGRVIHEASADAGTRRVLHDALDRPVLEQDAKGALRELRYDALDRPVERWLTYAGRRRLAERLEYGESAVDGRERNARGRLLRRSDPAGLLEVLDYDPLGNVLARSRRLTRAIEEPDWSGEVVLDAPHVSRFSNDALGRVVREELPDETVRQRAFLRSGGLTDVRATAAGREHSIISRAEFNARGQRTEYTLGNGVVVTAEHDPETFRLRRSYATRDREGVRQLLLDARHTYDPTGRLVHLVDEAQQVGRALVLSGQSVGSERLYRYDFRYQLVEATGRMHRALAAFGPTSSAARGAARVSLSDGGQISRYARSYRYDDSGNLAFVDHRPDGAGAGPRFTVDKWVSERSNRSLLRFDVDGTEVTTPDERFDAVGNVLQLEGLRHIEWNADDRLTRAVIVERLGGQDDEERYQYDGEHRRLRKVYRQLGDGVVTTTESIYLDGCELKRTWQGDQLILERWVSHFDDDAERKVATLHRWERDDFHRETDDPSRPRLHFVLTDSQGSSVLELTDQGEVIGYEEYFPYGRTAFVAGDIREVALRTIRFSGQEQDDATGLYYFQHRYYSPFLGNWLSPDPIAPSDSLNAYQYTLGDPINRHDELGLISGRNQRPVPVETRRGSDVGQADVPGGDQDRPRDSGESGDAPRPERRRTPLPDRADDARSGTPDPLEFPETGGEAVLAPGTTGPAGGEADIEAVTPVVPLAPEPPVEADCDRLREELGYCTSDESDDSESSLESPAAAEPSEAEIRDAQVSRQLEERRLEYEAERRARAEAVLDALPNIVTFGAWGLGTEIGQRLGEIYNEAAEGDWGDAAWGAGAFWFRFTPPGMLWHALSGIGDTLAETYSTWQELDASDPRTRGEARGRLQAMPINILNGAAFSGAISGPGTLEAPATRSQADRRLRVAAGDEPAAGRLRSSGAGNGIPETGNPHYDRLIAGTPQYRRWTETVARRTGLRIEELPLDAGVAAEIENGVMRIDPAQFRYIDLLHESRHIAQLERLSRQRVPFSPSIRDWFEKGAYDWERRLGARAGFTREYLDFARQRANDYWGRSRTQKYTRDRSFRALIDSLWH